MFISVPDGPMMPESNCASDFLVNRGEEPAPRLPSTDDCINLELEAMLLVDKIPLDKQLVVILHELLNLFVSSST